MPRLVEQIQQALAASIKKYFALFERIDLLDELIAGADDGHR